MPDRIIVPQTRMAWVTTENTGQYMEIRTAQGVIRLRRVDPHGVEVEFGGTAYGITAPHLAMVGRFFLAAGLQLGQDINEGWDQPQHKTEEGFQL